MCCSPRAILAPPALPSLSPSARRSPPLKAASLPMRTQQPARRPRPGPASAPLAVSQHRSTEGRALSPSREEVGLSDLPTAERGSGAARVAWPRQSDAPVAREEVGRDCGMEGDFAAPSCLAPGSICPLTSGMPEAPPTHHWSCARQRGQCMAPMESGGGAVHIAHCGTAPEHRPRTP